MPKPTMSDVAAHAGVDVSTVSRALNERTAGLVRSETVKRVLAAAKELGYQPNVLARGLRTQRSRTIGMVIPDLTNPFFPPIVRGLEDALEKAGYSLILANTDHQPERELRSLRSLVGRQVEGLMLATSHLANGMTDLPELAGIPVVLVNRRERTGALPSVVPDDVQGVELVVDHLVSLGHQRIAHIGGPQGTSTGATRSATFRRLAAEAGVLDEDLIEYSTLFDVSAGQAACEALLARRDDATCIVAGNDLLAIGCLRALRDWGRRVPNDISLVGFNDMPLVDLLDPPLTTVRVPQYEMGREAARIMLDLLQRPDEPATAEHRVEMPLELIVRRSTAPPRRSSRSA